MSAHAWNRLTRLRHALELMTILLCCAATWGSAQECNDSNDCTTNDMCSAGVCDGTPLIGNSCDTGTEALVNGRCAQTTNGVRCIGDRAPIGALCQRGCGVLEELFPGSASTRCVAKAELLGQACPNLDPEQRCVSGICEQDGPLDVVCRTTLTECPDLDGDACTQEYCSNETGQCESTSACGAECETCTPGGCVPANIGMPCQGNPCTIDPVCQAVEIPGLGLLGLCQAASLTVPTATPTSPPNTPTATPDERCIGDCDGDGAVKVSELVIGVNIALERAPFLACSRFDQSANQRVEVNELVRGVNSLLIGCSPAQ